MKINSYLTIYEHKTMTNFVYLINKNNSKSKHLRGR